MPVLEQVRETIEQHNLLAPGETVIVGVSGGPDSLCLLHCLHRLAGDYGLALRVAHLHHGLRGEDADADADFVRSLAGEWALPCTVERADVPALAQKERLAIEEAARRARYAFLRRVAVTAGARTIAVGHNADDQAETVLMHFLRGSGLAGLRGMLPRTPLADYRLSEADARSLTPTLHLIRPLLDVPRTEIESYCERHQLSPRFDRSNLDTTYFRNWLRHTVLPLLAQHNPGVRDVMRRSARVIAADYALLRSQLAGAWARVVVDEVLPGEDADAGPLGRIVFDLSAWRTLPLALQRASLREAIHRLRRSLRNINFVHVENALQVALHGTTGDRATLPRGLALTVGYDRLLVAGAGTSLPLPDWPLLPERGGTLPVLLPGVTPLPGSAWALEAEIVDRGALPPGWESNPDPWLAYLDAAVAGDGLVLRPRGPGDRFQPLGMGGHTVKLADFYTNQKVPHPARDRLPLLAGAPVSSGAGLILWVCGWRVDERARVQEATKRVLVARFVAGAPPG